jgi:glycosyltransferase involved in cell wall biosynthesis
MTAINLWCPTLDTVDSYGRMAVELSKGLEVDGWTVNEFCLSSSVRRPMHGQMVTGGILTGIPPLFKIYPTLAHIGPKLALTMFESTRVPSDWIEPLNQCAGLVVPSAFLIDAFRQSGVTIPISVVPLGISEAFHQYKTRVFTCTEEKPFTFIAIADRGIRKNWAVAAQAFNKAFGDDPRYRLILKSRTGVINFPVLNPNIEVIAQDMTDDEMCQLYHRAHAMIFPSRGEGFGFPPREFAATGGLALATDWGGTADDIDRWGVPVCNYVMEPAYKSTKAWAGAVGEWAAPDVTALTHMLRAVVEDYAPLNARSESQARFVRTNYTWAKFAQGIAAAYQEMSRECQSI